MLKQDYLSLVGKKANSQEVTQFFNTHKASWSSANVYKDHGVTYASLELYDSQLELEFIKRLSPKSEVTQQAKDFILSSITIINHDVKDHDAIGNIVGPIRLGSRFKDIAQVLGENYEENRRQGTYCWRYDQVTVELDYETTQDHISYIVLSADTPEIKAIKEVEKNFSDGALSQEASEDLGIEPPDLPYEDEPVTLDYDNVPVVERESGNRAGLIVIIGALVLALFFYDEVANHIEQLF